MRTPTFSSLIPAALLSIAEIGEPHRIKAALAFDHLHSRFPQWSVRQWQALLDHSQFHQTPRVPGPLTPLVTSPLVYGPRAAERLIANSVFPLAYRAAADWAAKDGVAAVIAHFRDRAVNEPGYLGHRLSIWLSFADAAAAITDAEQQALLLERFVEFAARVFRGFPHSDANWAPPPARSEGADFGTAFEVATRLPGFYGHHLIALAWATRGTALNDSQRQLAYRTVIEVATADYADAADRQQVAPDDAHGAPWDEQAWPGQLYDFAMAMRPNIHAITLADALAVLWAQSAEPGRQRLMAAMQVLARGTVFVG